MSPSSVRDAAKSLRTCKGSKPPKKPLKGSLAFWQLKDAADVFGVQRMFMSEGGVYMVVFDVKEAQNDRVKEERFALKWLSLLPQHQYVAIVGVKRTELDLSERKRRKLYDDDQNILDKDI